MRAPAALRRFKAHFKSGRPHVLADDHPAAVEGRTLFPRNRADPIERLLKSGIHQRKIGSRVTKGRWARMPIYTLTLEERATCPRACQHWQNCYGNNMHWPKRYRHGDALEKRLDVELAWLALKHPRGFVVRLHILGDFYSVEYVQAWRRFMYLNPMMRVFGYTARDRWEPIGTALTGMRLTFRDRWWIRWSHGDKRTWLSTGDSGIVCPVQTNKTDCCGTCGLCWTVKKPIKFLEH